MAIPPRRHPIRTFLKTYPHVWYLLIWIVYLMLFWLAEHLIVDKYGCPIFPSTIKFRSAGSLSFPTVPGTRCCF